MASSSGRAMSSSSGSVTSSLILTTIISGRKLPATVAWSTEQMLGLIIPTSEVSEQVDGENALRLVALSDG
jgi:hypothetical protein